MEGGWTVIHHRMNISKYGVPLIMVNGDFRSLHTMNVEELESFIPFMTSCALKKPKAAFKKGVPKWWARSINFKFPLKKPKGLSDLGYLRHLKSIVCKCYGFHNAHFLLTFSSQFAEYPQSIFLKRNDNNTTSVFSIENVSELFTFDNENKDYDKKSGAKSSWKAAFKRTSRSNPRVFGEIYLCENCDVEFYNHTDMENHEKDCFQPCAQKASNEIQVLTHVKPKPAPKLDKKDSFFDYFGLCTAEEHKKQEEEKERQRQQQISIRSKLADLDLPSEPVTGRRWVILDMCLHKNRKIEFSSMVGREMLKYRVRRDILSSAEKAIIAVREVCSNTYSEYNSKDVPKPKITFKPSKKKIWNHTYCFTRKQRQERLTTIRTGLNKRSRELLKMCKPAVVRMRYLVLPEGMRFLLCCGGKALLAFNGRVYLEWLIELF